MLWWTSSLPTRIATFTYPPPAYVLYAFSFICSVCDSIDDDVPNMLYYSTVPIPFFFKLKQRSLCNIVL
jgi:hypothetical protein